MAVSINTLLPDISDERTTMTIDQAAIDQAATVEPAKTVAPAATAHLQLAAAALEQAGDGIIAIDPSGTITLWNRHATKLFGYTAEQAIGRPVDIIIPTSLRAAHHRAFSAAMASGHLASDGRARRTKGITADGGKVYVTMTFAMIKGDDDATLGAVAVAREYVQES